MKKLNRVVASLALLTALLIGGGVSLSAATPGCGDPCVCCDGTCHCPCCQK